MNKAKFTLMAWLFSACLLHAQSGEILTNSSIVKMVNAKLADELIIDVIQGSTVRFNLSNDSVQYLVSAKVSEPVLEAMRKASGQPYTSLSAQAAGSISRTAAPASGGNQEQALEAYGYVTPMARLVTYYEDEFKKLASSVDEWDARIRDSIQAIGKINAELLQVDRQLNEKKNADSKAFSDEILQLKKKQSALRTSFRASKNRLVATGASIVSRLEDMSKSKVKSVSDRYNSVSQSVKSFDPDPLKGETGVPVAFNELEIREDVSELISPLKEMLVWHLNEIRVVRDLITTWNARVSEVVIKDRDLRDKLEPLQASLKEYSTDARANKTEIADLKKQISALEKERGALEDKMEDDSGELAAALKSMSEKTQTSVEQRFADMISNINYAFQEKLTF